MESDDRRELEAVGQSFSAARLLDVRLRTRAPVNEIARRARPGMTEDEVHQAASDALHEAGLRKGWHKILVRCGRTTILDFMDPSEPVVVGPDDIFGFRPSERLWVLEIQIRHPTRDIGAFFEDLLLTDDDLQRLAFSDAPAGT